MFLTQAILGLSIMVIWTLSLSLAPLIIFIAFASAFAGGFAALSWASFLTIVLIS